MKGRRHYLKKAKSRKMGRGRSGGLMKKLVWCGRRSFSHQSSESESAREGYVRVVVGKVGSEVVFYEMDAIYLNHPLVEKLLSLTGEEYGYSYEGALRIACDIHLFRYLIQLLSTGNPGAHYMDLPDLISKFNFQLNN
ncbi:auxin-responsive protein SAUR15 [Heracleum sosnowskyi]|uniref:Auxin-responsive protein SAUR15 n=1 Tax=Heracleum sosnowskyi TaxID=360622 RepID=A0AAD8MXW1_9APIA|nr:auxin-responsive protein SAUR15 [Heracleum sosnowskyi]